MTLVRITTHEAEGVAHLTEVYRKPRITAMLEAYLAEVQLLETVFWDLMTKPIDDAEGVVLDVFGKIVGQPRQGRSDSQYRLWIRGRIAVNRSSGLTRQLLALVVLLSQQPLVELRDYPPAAFVVYCRAPIVGADGVEIAKLLKLAKAAGVAMHFVWYDVPTRFRFSMSGASVFNSSQGFGEGRAAAVSDGRDMEFLPAAPEEAPDMSGALLVVL